MGRDGPSRSSRHSGTRAFPAFRRDRLWRQHDHFVPRERAASAFAIEGKDRTISELRTNPSVRAERVIVIEGETRNTVPVHHFDAELDLVLLDGPHAYPLPQLEFAYLFPLVRIGGWLVIDDIQIPAVHELFRFLKRDTEVILEEIVVRTAFFRRVKAIDIGPDGWEFQAINRRTILRIHGAIGCGGCFAGVESHPRCERVAMALRASEGHEDAL